jgi:hypothetical protein
MNKLTRIATPLIAVAMMTVPMMAQAPSSPMMRNVSNNSTTTDWTTPPTGMAQPQAYRDGIEAAKLDRLAKRRIDATKSHLYVSPPVKKGEQREEYRQSFVAGYQAATQHGAMSSGE